jgi:oligogalacturonide lyase
MGGLFLDATEKVLYAGAQFEPDVKYGLLALDLKTAQWRNFVDVDHKVGHVQANPGVPGLIMFCWETGGDSPQRTWLVNSDGSGLRPFYKETYDEWVTHEVWWGNDRALFTVWPYDDAHKAKPHGVFEIDRTTGRHEVLYQMAAWHTHGSPNLRWVMADDFERNLWLIDPRTRQRRLLTQGHLSKPFTTHPHASFTPDSRAIVFNSSKFGADNILLVELPEWDSLPDA